MAVHVQMGQRRSSHSHTLVIFLLLGLYLLLGCFCQGTNECKKYTVLETNRNMCVDCTLCPTDSPLVHSKCQGKYRDPIVNQGYAWCTAPHFPRPSCPKWEIANGNLKCDKRDKFSIGSKCKVQCNEGYSATFEKEVECLEELHWNVGESSRPSCHRTGSPGQPKIISSAIRSQVRPDSDVKLTCNNTTVPVGNARYLWYFNNQELQNEAHSNTYNIMTVKKTDEGIYRCVILDKIGKSPISSDYRLEVENNPIEDEAKKAVWFIVIVLIVGIAFLTLFMVSMYWLCKNSFLPKISCCTSNCSDKRALSESDSSASSKGECGNDEETESLADFAIPEEIQPEEIQCITSLTYSESHSVSMPPSSSFHITEENQTQTSHTLSYSQNVSPQTLHLIEVANNDQKALRNLLENKKVMDQIKVYLDQYPDENRNHPTFKDLGRFLDFNQDWIAHIEYKCGKDDSTPTEQLLLTMTHYGLGFNLFKQFLESHGCSQLIRIIQTEMQWEIQ